MNKKILCISVLIGSMTFLFGQNEDSKTDGAYRKAKKQALPLLDEGTRPRNESVLDSIALDLESSQGGSFEYHLVTYMHSHEKIRDAYHLQQAMALSPEDTDLLGEALEYYGMIADEASLLKVTTKLRKYGLYRKFDRYYKDFNALMKINDVLFTNGESDTRPLLMNRSESEADYEIIRIAWLSDPIYLIDLRSRGIMCPEQFDSPSDFIRKVIQQNPDRRVLLSPTLNPELLSKFNSELTASGLGLSIGNENLNEVVKDYEHISSTFLDSETITSTAIGMNYLPLLRAARKEYLQKDDRDKASQVKVIMQRILNSNGLEILEDELLK